MIKYLFFRNAFNSQITKKKKKRTTIDVLLVLKLFDRETILNIETYSHFKIINYSP